MQLDCTVINIVNQTIESLSRLPITEIKRLPEDITGPIFDYIVPAGISQSKTIISLPLGGTLNSIGITASETTTYEIFINDDKNNSSQPLMNDNGSSIFSAFKTFTFDVKIPENSELVIKISNLNDGTRVKIFELKMCLPNTAICRLKQEEVLKALGFLTVNNIVGETMNNETVHYGDIIEEGVIITGFCYECTCHKIGLSCEASEDDCNSCPKPNIQCKGDCSYAETTITFNETGVPDHCQNDSTPCVPEGCTTPHECPGPWTSWSSCNDNCQQFRSRVCGKDCANECVNFNATESQSCDINCVTVTPTPICDNNEVPSCVSKYDQCIESCAVFRKNATCDALNDDDTCIDNCKCKDGYMRNAFGNCERQAECECYKADNSTDPIPPGFIVNISQCVYCTCETMGYECKEYNDCCEIHEWSDWSPCSTTCGDGIITREREIFGNNCPSEVRMTETQNCKMADCPCFYKGEYWAPGRVETNKCQECTCYSGQIQCKNFTNPGPEVWYENCTKKCYCGSNGEMTCSHSHELEECQAAIKKCDLTTHVLVDTEEPCCKRCVPVVPCIFKAQSTIQLNVTDKVHGLCVSTEHQEVGSCSGTCGVSKDMVVETVYNSGKFELFTSQECSCCKASIDSKSVQFTCADGTNTNYDVSFISGCSCERCT